MSIFSKKCHQFLHHYYHLYYFLVHRLFSNYLQVHHIHYQSAVFIDFQQAFLISKCFKNFLPLFFIRKFCLSINEHILVGFFHLIQDSVSLFASLFHLIKHLFDVEFVLFFLLHHHFLKFGLYFVFLSQHFLVKRSFIFINW